MSREQFSKIRPITNKALEGVPANKPGVYRIKNIANDVLYIGKAKGGRLPDRIREHKGEISGGTRFQYKITKNSDLADALEKREIRKHNPPVNKAK